MVWVYNSIFFQDVSAPSLTSIIHVFSVCVYSLNETSKLQNVKEESPTGVGIQ